MYWRLLIVLAVTIQGAAVRARVPVVVELFTSEGCSSCPPADVLLTRLLKEQPVAGAEIIPIALHVTYWDQLGWKDPASLAEATSRQQEYGRAVFGVDNVYTPQAVVDGRTELVGSDEGGLRRAIAQAAGLPHAAITVEASAKAPDAIVATVVVTRPTNTGGEALRISSFLTEDGLTSVVKRGENGGRTLHNDAVVRRIVTRSEKQLASTGPAMTVEFAKLPADWRRDHLHFIAIVQGEKTYRIYAAAMTEIRH
jgi:hypothetical protein